MTWVPLHQIMFANPRHPCGVPLRSARARSDIVCWDNGKSIYMCRYAITLSLNFISSWIIEQIIYLWINMSCTVLSLRTDPNFIDNFYYVTITCHICNMRPINSYQWQLFLCSVVDVKIIFVTYFESSGLGRHGLSPWIHTLNLVYLFLSWFALQSLLCTWIQILLRTLKLVVQFA